MIKTPFVPKSIRKIIQPYVCMYAGVGIYVCMFIELFFPCRSACSFGGACMLPAWQLTNMETHTVGVMMVVNYASGADRGELPGSWGVLLGVSY